LIDALAASGVTAHPPSTASPDATDAEGRALLLRVGVAGFAAMNVMLLSISVWSGADAATRDLLHWVSALIALPTVAYAGQPFFKSAARALARWRLNMDVPISLAVLLSALYSVAETAQSAEHAYFDAAVMLMFFLLIGRYLEHRSRHIARSAASELMAMTGRTARLITPDGSRETAPLTSIDAGMLVEVLPGERIPVDGIIVDGQTELDRALISGESAPESASIDAPVYAGMLNLTGLISIKVTAVGDETLLAEIAALVDAAERGRGRYDRIADRAARLYAPLVHLLAAAAFLGWFWATTDARLALQIAVAVLIVTCPCALALAVPTVHTVTSRRLFGRGIFLKDGGELERLADIDMVAFDKTGTLTTGVPSLTSAPDADDACWPVAAALASASRHPCAVAIAEESSRLGVQPAPVQDVAEEPGIGVSGRLNGQFVRLGRQRKGVTSGTTTWLEIGERVVSFQFTETLRPDAAACCDALRRKGLDLAILSGDSPAAVKKMALATGIGTALGGLVPGEKLGWLNDQKATGRKVLMVGDGLNDGPALAAAHASISPVSATDVAKTAAGLVVTGDSLSLVNTAHDAALTARRRSLQSFAIAAGYNAVAIPLAASGAMTPLIAAAAMSLSSLLVILNALRPRRSA
ncbi:MAG: copper-translocating P-type ATPase, partial [Pseudomonadota bacterium]